MPRFEPQEITLLIVNQIDSTVQQALHAGDSHNNTQDINFRVREFTTVRYRRPIPFFPTKNVFATSAQPATTNKF